jgi:hypothetical protein
VDLFQPPGAIASSVRGDHVDVSGPSCPDHPFSTELGDTEINTQIRGVLAHEVNLNLGSGSVPLREGSTAPG